MVYVKIILKNVLKHFKNTTIDKYKKNWKSDAYAIEHNEQLSHSYMLYEV